MSHSQHDHDHDHSQGAHHHHPSVTKDSQKRVFWVMVFTGSYLIVQVIGGILSGSLALLADAGHMLSDTAALALAWVAFRLASKPADAKRTFGYGRFQILAAFVNGLTLFVIALWISIEAITRFYQPAPIMALPMLIVASIGLLVNLIGFAILHRGDKNNVNMRGALLHVIGDLLGSVAAIAAAIIIMLTNWLWVDPLLAILVAILILKSAWGLVKDSGHILLEGTPKDLNPEAICRELADNIPDVIKIHHLHLWSITGEQKMATLHVLIEANADWQQLTSRINDRLSTQFGIDHATLQVTFNHDLPTPENCLSITPNNQH